MGHITPNMKLAPVHGDWGAMWAANIMVAVAWVHCEAVAANCHMDCNASHQMQGPLRQDAVPTRACPMYKQCKQCWGACCGCNGAVAAVVAVVQLPVIKVAIIEAKPLETWSVIDKVKAIDVPTLLISGRYDEATPAVVQPFADNIKGARWVIFEKSSHLPHVEETEKCMKTVAAFLAEND